MDQSVHLILDKNCRLLDSIVTEHDYLKLDAELNQRIGHVVSEVNEKISSSQIRLAIVGGFSSGKSTLINALIGAPVLAAKVTPATICPTYIKRGEKTRLIVKGNWAGQRDLSTPFPGELRLSCESKGLSPVNMQDLGDCTFAGSIQFTKPGIYEVKVMDGTKVLSTMRVPVLDCSRPTPFYYNLLSGCSSYSGQYFHIPKDKTPKVWIKDSDGTRSVSLRCCDFSNEWSSVANLPEEVVYIQFAFDWDWFSQMRPTVIRKRKPEGLLDKIKMFFSKISGFGFAELPEPCLPTFPQKIDNTKGDFTKVRFSLDLENGVFQWSQAEEPVLREFLFDEGDIERASSFVSAVTATGSSSEDADFSGVVEHITIEHPDVKVDESVVIIDTPGIAAESEHTRATVSIVRNEADACLFLCPSDQAGTLRDLEFVEENLMNVVGGIAFVITKSDKASDEEELEEIVESVRGKIEERLGISNPTILTVSAKDAIKGRRRGQDQFNEFIHGITRFSVRNRERILARRLAQVERSVMEELTDNLKKTKEEYESQRRMLQEYVIEDLEDFADRHAKSMDENFLYRVSIGNLKGGLLDALERHMYEQTWRVIGVMRQCENQEALKKFCSNELPKLYADMSRNMIGFFESRLSYVDNWLKDVARQILSEFERSFEEEYPLRRIGGTVIGLNNRVVLGNLNMAEHTGTELGILNSAEGEQGTAATWGAGVGVLVGTFIAPGLGSIIGGVAGALLGSLFGPSLDDIKKDVQADIIRNAEQYFTYSISPAVDRVVDERIEETRKGIRLVLEQYLRAYKGIVQSLIRDHERKKKEIDQYVFQAQTVLNEIEYRLEELEALLK